MIGKVFSQSSLVTHEIDATCIDQISVCNQKISIDSRACRLSTASRADCTVATPISPPSETLMDFHPLKFLRDRITATILVICIQPGNLHRFRGLSDLSSFGS